MKSISTLFFLSLSLVSLNSLAMSDLSEDEKSVAISRYTVQCKKDALKKLKKSIDCIENGIPAKFKEIYDEYAVFLENDQKRKDSLKQYFQATMRKQLYKFNKLQRKIDARENKTFLKNINKTKVLKGIASCGVGIACGALTTWMIKRTLHAHHPSIGHGHAIAYSAVGALGFTANGINTIANGLNYNTQGQLAQLKYEKDYVEADISTLDSAYAYVFPNETPLSTWMRMSDEEKLNIISTHQ